MRSALVLLFAVATEASSRRYLGCFNPDGFPKPSAPYWMWKVRKGPHDRRTDVDYFEECRSYCLSGTAVSVNLDRRGPQVFQYFGFECNGYCQCYDGNDIPLTSEVDAANPTNFQPEEHCLTRWNNDACGNVWETTSAAQRIVWGGSLRSSLYCVDDCPTAAAAPYADAATTVVPTTDDVICPFLASMLKSGHLPRQGGVQTVYTESEMFDLAVNAGLPEDVVMGHVNNGNFIDVPNKKMNIFDMEGNVNEHLTSTGMTDCSSSFPSDPADPHQCTIDSVTGAPKCPTPNKKCRTRELVLEKFDTFMRLADTMPRDNIITGTEVREVQSKYAETDCGAEEDCEVSVDVNRAHQIPDRNHVEGMIGGAFTMLIHVFGENCDSITEASLHSLIIDNLPPAHYHFPGGPRDCPAVPAIPLHACPEGQNPVSYAQQTGGGCYGLCGGSFYNGKCSTNGNPSAYCSYGTLSSDTHTSRGLCEVMCNDAPACAGYWWHYGSCNLVIKETDAPAGYNTCANQQNLATITGGGNEVTHGCTRKCACLSQVGGCELQEAAQRSPETSSRRRSRGAPILHVASVCSAIAAAVALILVVRKRRVLQELDTADDDEEEVCKEAHATDYIGIKKVKTEPLEV